MNVRTLVIQVRLGPNTHTDTLHHTLILKYRIAGNFHRILFSEILETSGIFQIFFYKMVL